VKWRMYNIAHECFLASILSLSQFQTHTWLLPISSRTKAKIIRNALQNLPLMPFLPPMRPTLTWTTSQKDLSTSELVSIQAQWLPTLCEHAIRDIAYSETQSIRPVAWRATRRPTGSSAPRNLPSFSEHSARIFRFDRVVTSR
jgi:hypothetical protein